MLPNFSIIPSLAPNSLRKLKHKQPLDPKVEFHHCFQESEEPEEMLLKVICESESEQKLGPKKDKVMILDEMVKDGLIQRTRIRRKKRPVLNNLVRDLSSGETM
jgi:hypothetical protein